MYTAKFVFIDEKGKHVGSSSEIYNTVEGYQTGVATVISNMANIASHRGRVRHLPDADLFAVTLKCHDPEEELFFLSISRNRVTLSSYNDETIRKRVERWSEAVPALAQME